MHQTPASPSASPPLASPLGQAIAAIIALLIAALAEHAAEHPMLAPGLRAAIRRLETASHRLQAMVAEWEAIQSQEPNPGAGSGPPQPHRAARTPTAARAAARWACVLAFARIRAPRRAVATCNRAPRARAPPLAGRPCPPRAHRNSAAERPKRSRTRVPYSAASAPAPTIPTSRASSA